MNSLIKSKLAILIIILLNYSSIEAQIFINEVLASNITTNTNPDTYRNSDWIELYNSGNQYINLAGYSLTDNISKPDKWTFPTGLGIAANSYLIVWADELDTALIGIHTNFKLSSFGETLALYKPDNSLSDLFTFRSQVADVSIGRKPDGNSVINYFSSPTPSQSNNSNSFTGITPLPEFSLKGGYYQNSINVSITCASATAQIRYTTDGTEPTINSNLYAIPFTINNLITIRAIAFNGGNYLPSDVVSETYYLPQNNFTPAIPIISINTGGQDIPDYPSINAHMAVLSGELNTINDFDNQISIQVRGSSSQGFPKKQYKIETQNCYDEDIDIKLLDLPAESDWILYAPYCDKTLIRDVLAYQTSGFLGNYSPRTKYCELFLNNEYMGVYVLVENVKKNDNRVNISNLEVFDDTQPDISGGYIFKFDRGNQMIWTQSGLSFVPVYPKEENITNQQINWIQNYLNQLETTLNSGGEGFQNYINDTSFVDNFLMVEAFKNIDGYRLSTFFNKDKNQKLEASPIWDYNLSSGNADYLEGWEPTGWYIDLISYDYTMTYYWVQLKNNPIFWQLCADRWFNLRQNYLNTDFINSTIDNYTEYLNEAQARNFEKWQILGTYVWPNYFIGNTYEEEILFMKQFLQDRFNWIDQQFGYNSISLNYNLTEENQGTILVNDVIDINKYTKGTYLSNTQINLKAIPNAGYELDKWSFATSLPTDVTLIEQNSQWKYLDNGSNQGTDWYGVIFNDENWNTGIAEFGYGDGDENTVISYGENPEVKYTTTYFRKTFNVQNVTNIVDLQLNILRDDGAVIYLNGNEILRTNMPIDVPIDYQTFSSGIIGGLEETVFNNFVIPINYLVEGENIIAVEIHQSDYTSSDISFNLFLKATYQYSNITTTYSDNTEIDTFFTQNTDITIYFKERTFSEGLYINEIMAQNTLTYSDEAGSFDDWIEIYNSNNYAVNLAGYFLTDDKSVPLKWQIPATEETLTTIEPYGYKVFWADNDINEGLLHTNFKLGAGGEFVGLSYFEGMQYYADSLTFGLQTSDISYGRYEDGEQNLQFFSQPTPNSSNILTSIHEPEIEVYNSLICYPNPMNQFATIEFNLQNDENVTLCIYDITGKLVQFLINEQMKSGKYSLLWEPYKTTGLNLNGNIFIAQLKTKTTIENFKIIMIK